MSKQLIIDIDCDLLNRIHEAKSVPDMYGTDIVNAINAIKLGAPTCEKPQSEWVPRTFTNPRNFYKFTYWRCSNCEGEVNETTDYCPYCGIKMRTSSAE